MHTCIVIHISLHKAEQRAFPSKRFLQPHMVYIFQCLGYWSHIGYKVAVSESRCTQPIHTYIVVAIGECQRTSPTFHPKNINETKPNHTKETKMREKWISPQPIAKMMMPTIVQSDALLLLLGN